MLVPFHSQHSPTEKHSRAQVPPHTQLPLPSHVSICTKLSVSDMLSSSASDEVPAWPRNTSLHPINLQILKGHWMGQELASPVWHYTFGQALTIAHIQREMPWEGVGPLSMDAFVFCTGKQHHRGPKEFLFKLFLTHVKGLNDVLSHTP